MTNVRDNNNEVERFPESERKVSEYRALRSSFATFSILGRLGKQPEKVTTQKGGLRTQLVISAYKNVRTESGEFQRETVWYYIEVYSPQLVNTCLDFLKKGDLVCVDGYIDKRNTEESKNKIILVAESVFKLVAGKSGENSDNESGSSDSNFESGDTADHGGEIPL